MSVIGLNATLFLYFAYVKCYHQKPLLKKLSLLLLMLVMYNHIYSYVLSVWLAQLVKSRLGFQFSWVGEMSSSQYVVGDCYRRLRMLIVRP
jgi:hypothetical protein